MQKFQVSFKNDNDKKITLLAMMVGIIFGFISFLVVSFGFKNDLSESSLKIINAFLNFDIILFIIFIVAVTIMPYLYAIVHGAVFLINLLVILKAVKAINENQTEVEIPVIFTIF